MLNNNGHFLKVTVSAIVCLLSEVSTATADNTYSGGYQPLTPGPPQKYGVSTAWPARSSSHAAQSQPSTSPTANGATPNLNNPGQPPTYSSASPTPNYGNSSPVAPALAPQGKTIDETVLDSGWARAKQRDAQGLPGSVHANPNERPPVPEDKASMTPLEKSKLAYWYWKTERVSKLPRAVQLMTEAAEAGDSRSQAVLGDWYMRGIRDTLPVDEAKSFYWNSKAAAQGQRTAQMSVGDNYYNGIVVPKDYAKSFEYFMKAAQQGWPVAELAVAEAYCTGEGVAENRAQALAWFNKSKADGCTSAQNFLDILALPNCPAHFSSFKELLSYGHGYEKVQADRMRAQSTAAIGQNKMFTSPRGSDEYRRGQQIYNGAQQSINNANRSLDGYGH